METKAVYSSGVVRKIDSLGRICIPKSVRDRLEFNEFTPVEILYGEDKLILKKYQPGCNFCGNINEKKYTKFLGKLICSNCLEEIKSSK